MHKVAILTLDDFVLFDLAIPADMFSRARSRNGEILYDTIICADKASTKGTLLSINVSRGIDAMFEADTIIVPGIEVWTKRPCESNILEALRVCAKRGTRIASICTGAFVLAEAGLLDGIRATTHWLCVDDLARRYPKIIIEPDILFVDNGQILTSAGVSAGVDLCLHMIRKDYGAGVAEYTAQGIVMPIARNGSYTQRLKRDSPEDDDILSQIQMWMMDHITQEFRIEQIAEQFHMSTRTLNRWFRDRVGVTPMQWVSSVRVRQAQLLLESTHFPIEHIALSVGFPSAAAFRENFSRQTGTTPTAWRNTYVK